MFQKQVMMRRVVYSLVPIFLYSVWLYGYRSILIVLVSLFFGILTEYLYLKPQKKKVSEAVFITSVLFAFSMPPNIPLWIVALGIIFGVLFGKCVYGGFGRNVFNPAISGRIFVYLAFPGFLTGNVWYRAGHWGQAVSDGVTSPTLLGSLKGISVAKIPLLELFLGNRAGSIGESSILLLLLAAVYLVYTKTANWRSIVATLLGFSLVYGGLYYTDLLPVKSLSLIESLFTGSIFFVAVFMVTDPVTAPKKEQGLWIYGLLIGAVSCIVRVYSLFPEGVTFGVLVGNVFASLIDEIPFKKKPVKKAAAGKKAGAKKPAAAGGKV